jgi:hypothetical protein
MYNLNMSGRVKLLQLEQEGNYLFHGSPDGDIQVLEPKQGKHVPDLSKPDEVILDGKPAVSTTPYVDFAIFRAIINKKNIPIPFISGFGFKNGKKEFHVSKKEALEIAKNKKGFVYVFTKDDFEPYQRGEGINLTQMEWRSYKEVKPVGVIEVTYEDLLSQEEIEIK